MKLTQEQWYQKLRGWVPAWVFENERYQVAVFYALAKVFERAQQDAVDHFNATFLDRAEGFFLDAHGDERNVERITQEPDAFYRPRIKNIVNTTPRFRIQKAVDDMLLVGKARIIEYMLGEGPFFNRNTFYNRFGVYTNRRLYNHFTVIIPRQDPVSNSFYSRSTFYSRGNYLGSSLTLPKEVLLESINRTIARMKAYGVSFRLIEEDMGVA